MTGKEFLNSLANGKSDILQELLVILSETDARYCVIGGLAVNAYVEPVVSLDVDIVIAVDDIEAVTASARKHEWKVECFEHSINIGSPDSDLRIQIQTDPRFQGFIAAAETGNILGYTMRVAALGDLLQGKVWAWMDETRRRSKRQKDLADILRLIEAFPELEAKLPQSLKKQLLEE
ncbi:MAG TPA: hypothetical protein PLY86_11170 [bacterium]|nr:hypothetical protein [bacterium]